MKPKFLFIRPAGNWAHSIADVSYFPGGLAESGTFNSCISCQWYISLEVIAITATFACARLRVAVSVYSPAERHASDVRGGPSPLIGMR